MKERKKIELARSLTLRSRAPLRRKEDITMVLLSPSPGRYLLALLLLSVLVVLPLALAISKLKTAPDRLRRRR